MFTTGIPIPINEHPKTIVLHGKTRYQMPINISGNDMQTTDIGVEHSIHKRALQSAQRWRRIELPIFHGSTRALQMGQRFRSLPNMSFRENSLSEVSGDKYGFTSGMIQCTNDPHSSSRRRRASIRKWRIGDFDAMLCSS